MASRQKPLRSKALDVSRSAKPRRVCIVTGELFGWNSNSDAAASVLALAQFLAKLGDTITLLWVPTRHERDNYLAEIEKVRQTLFERYLIRLFVLSSSPQLLADLYRNDQASLAVLHHLEETPYDVVYFALEGGLGHFAMTAKQTGMLGQRPALVVVAHEPLLWRCEANRHFVENKQQLIMSHMERMSVELCDHLVAGTQDVLAWMKQNGWRLPKEISVLPCMLPLALQSEHDAHRTEGKQPGLNEIIFIGEPEPRYGLSLFCDAVDVLARSLAAETTVTMIGGFGRFAGEHTGGMVLRRARKWPFRLRILPRLKVEEVVGYIRSRNCLVVIPNLATQIPQTVSMCLDARVPFIATNVGGTAEMILPKAVDLVLCDPKAGVLADKISSNIKVRPEPQKLARNDRAGGERLWEKFHIEHARRREAHPAAKSKTKQPLVSIVTAHYDRPQYLQQAVDSVRGQDYPNIELVIVDDGSKSTEAHRLLDALEPEFRQRKWRILREKNRFLGAARNTGIRAARGQMILFLDDDNALFPSAVSDLVNAMERSGADICTTFAKLLHEPFVPTDTTRGFIQYYPVGGPLDLAIFQDPYGDANALFRRDVFEKIGFLNELRGFSASDWEFFTRADLAGLRIAVVPKALYWYRSDPSSMHLSSSWYENRVPIIELFRKHKFKGLKLFYELAVSQNTEEKQVARWNLDFSPSNEVFARLADLDPVSDEACDALAEAAAVEGRADTAIMLLGQAKRPEFRQRLAYRLAIHTHADQALAELGADFTHEEPVTHDTLRHAALVGASGRLTYTEKPAHLYLATRGEVPTIVVLPEICPKGTLGVAGWAFMDEAITGAGDFLLMLIPSSDDPVATVAASKALVAPASSGWMRLAAAREPHRIEARLPIPSERSLSLVIAARSVNGAAGIIAGFSNMMIRRALGAEAVAHPRYSPPPHRQRARALTRDEMKRADLVTPYSSELPLILFAPEDGAVFLRPSVTGNVAAVISHAFPPFARKAIASVEIAHEEAGPFEFALALSATDQKVDWSRGDPRGVLAFSGWKLIEDRFQLCEVSVELQERTKAYLSIQLAIRLPRGSRPSPANAFWRRIVIVWDDE